MDENEKMVAGADSASVAEEELEAATPSAEQVVEGGEMAEQPALGVRDAAEAEIERLKEDINRLKSSSQQREHELVSQYQAQLEAIQRYIMELENQRMAEAMANMPEEERRIIQLEAMFQQKIRQLEDELNAIRQERIAEENRRNAARAFAEITGIPEEEIYRAGTTPEAMKKFVRDKIEELKKEREYRPPQAPKVTAARRSETAGGGLLSKWAELSDAERERIIERARMGDLSPGEL